MASRLTDIEREARAINETQLTSYCRELAKVTHWRRYHTYRSERSPAGFPDEVYIRVPHIIVAELKAQMKYETPEQRKWLDDFAGCMFTTYLWKPSDMLDGSIANIFSDPQRFGIEVPSRWLPGVGRLGDSRL